MESFAYLLLLIVCYLGLPVGTVISHFTKEELLSGKKYFIFFQLCIFSLAFFMFLFKLTDRFIASIFCSSIALAIGYFWRGNQISIQFMYSLFAIALYETHSPVIGALIFFFGIIESSQNFEDTRFIHNATSALSKGLIFLFVGVLLMILI